MQIPDFKKVTDFLHKNLSAIGVILFAIGISMFLASRGTVVSYVASDGTKGFFELFAPTFEFGTPLEASAPIRLRIPDIYIDTHFVELGLDANGEVETPKGFEEVGWYIHGPTPGEIGPAIVLGHVDSYMGPAVFLFLGQLTQGDYIYVDREDGSTATFRVTALERYNRSEFPTEKVYGDIDHAGLRLITCSGTFDHTSQEYDRVLVVYAALVDEEVTE
ncbi:MAG: class F sortase [Patescibacteria group bacterium]